MRYAARGRVARMKQASAFPAWFLLTGILLIPSSVLFYVAGESGKFTSGRLAITLLFIPAVVKLMGGGRRFVISDLLILVTAGWMIGSRLEDDGLHPSAVAEVIELFGGYIVARAFFYGHQSLQTFLRVFRICMVIVILLASLEPLAGKDVILTLTNALGFPPPNIVSQVRFGLARAMSTIEDAELYGALCCVATVLTLYLAPPRVRWLWYGFCSFGVFLSLSSGPLLGWAVITASYFYDRMFKDFSWRWKLYGGTVALFVVSLFSVTSNPISWIISHLTLEPESGYFRLFVFDYVEDMIAVYPWKGWGFGPIGADQFLQNITVDNVWLVVGVRFGIPTVVLLLLTNIATFYPPVSTKNLNRAATAFTFALVAIMGIGVTVHYWNAMWMLWAVLLGTRASIKEFQQSTVRASRSVRPVLMEARPV